MSEGTEAEVVTTVTEEKSIFELFEMDNRAEKEGIIVNYGPYGKFRIARAGGANERFKKLMEAKSRPYRRRIETGTVTEEELRPMLLDVFVDAVILGWDGVTGKTGVVGTTGQPLQFTRENAIKLFTILPDLFDDIREQAAKSANFRAADIEADAKN